MSEIEKSPTEHYIEQTRNMSLSPSDYMDNIMKLFPELNDTLDYAIMILPLHCYKGEYKKFIDEYLSFDKKIRFSLGNVNETQFHIVRWGSTGKLTEPVEAMELGMCTYFTRSLSLAYGHIKFNCNIK